MSYRHTYRHVVGFVVALCFVLANVAGAEEGKHGKHHPMDMDYGDYYDGAYEGMKGHHGEIRGHGTKHGHGEKGGDEKQDGLDPKHQGHKGMQGDAHHPTFSLHALKKKLFLSDAQVDAIRPIEADYKKAVIRKKADVSIGEIDLGLLIDSPNPDRGKLKTIVETIGDMKGELMMARIDAFLNVKQELTPQQQKEFSTMVHGHMMGHAGSVHGKGLHHGKDGHGEKGHHGKKGHDGMSSQHGSSPHGMGH